MSKKKVLYVLFGAISALVLVFGAAATFAQTTTAQDGNLPLAETTSQQPLVMPGRHGFVDSEEHEQFLAEALGITVDELQTAYETARTAAVEQAVADELITQEQADAILAGEMGLPGFDRGRHGLRSLAFEAFLADALGISEEALEAARDEARAAEIQQAVADGTITADQAELMLAAEALKDYIDRDALLAGVLGVSVVEVEAAKEAGTLLALIDDSGLTAEAFQAAMQAAHEAAVSQAVADGIITQEQANQLQTESGCFGGLGGHGGRHGRPLGGFGPAQEELPTETAPAAGA